MVDCAPTILAALGLPIPEDMQGKVISALFDVPLEVRNVARQQVRGIAVVEEVYSDADLARVTERLSDLGYLE
jgi:hypothetical protein